MQKVKKKLAEAYYLRRGRKRKVKKWETSAKLEKNDHHFLAGDTVLDFFLREIVPNAKMAPDESIIQS